MESVYVFSSVLTCFCLCLCLVDYAKDLERYLTFCKDVVFGGVELPSEDNEENEMINDLWNFYQKKQACLCICYFICIYCSLL